MATRTVVLGVGMWACLAGACERGGSTPPSPDDRQNEHCDGGVADACMALADRIAWDADPEWDRRKMAWYDRACELGVAIACEELASAFRWGAGDTEPDFERALMLSNRACDGGHQGGCLSVAIAHAYGSHVPKDLEKARAMVRAACDEGYGPACNLDFRPGEVSTEAVHAVLTANLGPLEACPVEGDAGWIEVELSLGEERPPSVEITDTSPGTDATGTCMATALEALSFPPTEHGNAIVAYRFERTAGAWNFATATPRALETRMSGALFAPDPDPALLSLTDSAITTRKNGTGTVAFCVDESGRTVDVRTKKSFHGDEGVDAILVDTVKTWRFLPLHVDGKPRRTCATYEFQIRFT